MALFQTTLWADQPAGKVAMNCLVFYPKNQPGSQVTCGLEIPEPCELQSQALRFWRVQWFLRLYFFVEKTNTSN